jgi:hypothetical protein
MKYNFPPEKESINMTEARKIPHEVRRIEEHIEYIRSEIEMYERCVLEPRTSNARVKRRNPDDV